jgi:hypothetical protein
MRRQEMAARQTLAKSKRDSKGRSTEASDIYLDMGYNLPTSV